MAHLDVGRFHEQRGRQVQRAIEAGGAEHDLVRPLLGVVDEVLERLVRRLVVDDERHRTFGKTRDRDEIRARELGRPSEQLVHALEAGNRNNVDEQRVAVGLRVGGELRADLACGAGLGFDHDRLLDQRLQHGSERAADHIGGAARREWVDQRDRTGRVGFLGVGGTAGESGRGRPGHELASVHHLLRIYHYFSTAMVAQRTRGVNLTHRSMRSQVPRRATLQSRIAMARVQPADAAWIFTGKQLTEKPFEGSFSRLCSFSMWQ
jgi:hypothetical protein